MRPASRDTDALIREVTDSGRVVLDLTQVLQNAINSLPRERAPRGGARQGVGGGDIVSWIMSAWNPPPRDDLDEFRISDERKEAILANPDLYTEFIFANRRYRMIPIGTIEPVAKVIERGPTGAYFYMKKWDAAGDPLPEEEWTKVYLKDYQQRQCITGRGPRTRGLAGYVEGECDGQPQEPRRRAAREPKLRRRQNDSEEQSE